ncbi:Glutathione S-transferase [uncultured Synechococcales cyanobacterium]|uniref:Glutathione S-transferase n=1 Tax=uncultured Synechococcales cyanobacterium TaxID=1936017 RepID=A0A6J4V8G0_9CYAN|nr:Glutathione S-transferase [uncultured Synechococcales cyanobacterium]
MEVWQVDFYRRPLKDQQGHPLWELLICNASRSFQYSAFCPQPQANVAWLVSQFHKAASGKTLPEHIQVFRPQCFGLIEAASEKLHLSVEPTRRTASLKQWLQERAQEYPKLAGYTAEPHTPTELDRPPPLPLPEALWGEQWQFAALPAIDLEEGVIERPIPILEAPQSLLPSQLGLAKTAWVPGVVIYGGRQSMRLASWLQEQCPMALEVIVGAPNGLILEAGLVDRWVVATFEDPEVRAAGAEFERRKALSKNLHFLLVQPDNSGVTYSGFWLLHLS